MCILKLMVHSIQSMRKLMFRCTTLCLLLVVHKNASQFKMVNYQDVRNGKPYAISKISPTTIEYGKVKNGLETEPLTLPTFDLFTMAFQLSYYDKLPTSFQITMVKNFTQWKM